MCSEPTNIQNNQNPEAANGWRDFVIQELPEEWKSEEFSKAL